MKARHAGGIVSLQMTPAEAIDIAEELAIAGKFHRDRAAAWPALSDDEIGERLTQAEKCDTIAGQIRAAIPSPREHKP